MTTKSYKIFNEMSQEVKSVTIQKNSNQPGFRTGWIIPELYNKPFFKTKKAALNYIESKSA